MVAVQFKRSRMLHSLTIDYRAGFSDCEQAGTFPGNSAGSSSNSSLSTRSLDSPSTSLEQVHPATSATNTSTSWDSDVDVEPDPPDWSQGVAEDVLARLSNAEKKRQEVINGLFLLLFHCDIHRRLFVHFFYLTLVMTLFFPTTLKLFLM